MADRGLGALPPEDGRRPPLTGWTRAHWEHIADVLLEGVRGHASRTHALIFVPDSQGSARRRRSDGLEGFARTFLLAAARLAGSTGEAPGDLTARYARGLTAGTDPASGESWPPIRDVSQPMVEAAQIALGLALSRPWIWDRMSRGPIPSAPIPPPYLTCERMPLPEAVFVSLVMLSGGHIIASDALADVASVEVSGRQVAIACRDGECFFVHMVAAERVDRSLGPLPLEGSVRFARISPDGTTFTYRD